MINEKGNLSINSENILPIIKKWLYSDTDIFLREMVSNATDAITKLMKLDAIGEADIPADEQFYVKITLDKEKGTLTVSDNGIGMTAEEIKQYINQIAFSGASEFINKYKEKMEANDIIGHFGLGFYSAFMVSKTVRIDTLSYKEGAEAVSWTSDGGVDFEMSDSERKERGTDITLYINEESKEFLDEYRIRGVLRKYCAYMPVDIFFDTDVKFDDEDAKDDDSDTIDMSKTPQPVNEKNPLWNRKPNDVSDEEYKEFYHKAFTDFNEPLFWIHLNMDYPFRLKGILYFPKLSHELESIEGQVKLYNNQVFIAENIKEVIPEFLLLLKGAIDCPELPLNVSRSALQNDGYVTKMSAYITKKVADKLTSLFNEEREQFNKYWDDISPFIKYGCIKENDFYEKVKEALLFKTTDGEYLTIREYLNKNEAKTGKRIIYTTNEKQQSQYLSLTKEQGIDAVLMGTRIDNPYMSYIENYEREQGVKFTRIDSDLSEILKDDSDEAQIEADEAENLGKAFLDAIERDKLNIKVENLKNQDVPAIVILPEEARRMQEMSKMFPGMPFSGAEASEVLVLNSKNSLVKLLNKIKGDESKQEEMQLICGQIFDLAMMSHKQLDAHAMSKFMERSAIILEKMINSEK